MAALLRTLEQRRQGVHPDSESESEDWDSENDLFYQQ